MKTGIMTPFNSCILGMVPNICLVIISLNQVNDEIMYTKAQLFKNNAILTL